MYSAIQSGIKRFKEMSTGDKIKVLAPYIIACLLCVRIFEIWRRLDGNIGLFIDNLDLIIKAIPQPVLKDFIGAPVGVLGVLAFQYSRNKNQKHFRIGEEYGSSRWGTAEDIAPFIDPDPFNNIILSKTEMLTMNPKMKDFRLNRNKHVVVYGGSGSGKTFSFVKPNIMQCHSSYVLTDPKGTLLPETGALFEKMGYNIYVLDTIDMHNSMHYNPFTYIRQPKDILTLATALFTSLKPQNSGGGGDPFFDMAALLWLQCMIGYLYYEAPPEEQTIPVMLQFLEADDVREDDDTYENAVDLIFKELEEKKGQNHFAVKQRKKYKQAAGKTAKSILITIGAYLSKFDIPEVRELVQYDELRFDTYGDPGQKSILYIILSDTDTSFNFIPTLLFTQMFNVLCYRADKEMVDLFGESHGIKQNGALATPVQFIIDEFANVPQIPDFKVLIATVRSRQISIIMMLQTQSQLKDNYKEAAETITGNCDTSVFLGGKEKSTLKELEESLGKATIDLFTENNSFSTQESHGVNYNKVGRELKNVSELNRLDRNNCIVQLSGLHPFLSDKYPTTKHPNFKYTGDATGKMFSFAAYRRRKERREAAKRVSNIRFKESDTYMVL